MAETTTKGLIIIIITGVFTFLVGTSWNSLINDLIDTYLPNNKQSFIFRFIYVSSLTVAVILAVVWIVNHMPKWLN